MGQPFSRSINTSDSQGATGRVNTHNRRKPSKRVSNESFKIIRRQFTHPNEDNKYSPPATYGSFDVRNDTRNDSPRFYEVEISPPARFRRLANPPLPLNERFIGITHSVQNNESKTAEREVSRSAKLLIKRSSRPTSMSSAFHIQSRDVYFTPDDWWELFPRPEVPLTVNESCVVETEQVVVCVALTPVPSPSIKQPAPIAERPHLAAPYDISPIMNIIDRPSSLIEFFPSVDFPESSEQQVDEEFSDSEQNVKNYIMGLVQPYFFKASAYMALSHSQIQREVWGAITVHLQQSLKGKTIAFGTDPIFFSAEKLHKLLEEEERSVVGFLEYLKDISRAWKFTQLLQKLTEMFDFVKRI